MSILRLNASTLEKKKVNDDIQSIQDVSSLSYPQNEVLIRPEELPKVQKHFKIFYLNRLQYQGRLLED